MQGVIDHISTFRGVVDVVPVKPEFRGSIKAYDAEKAKDAYFLSLGVPEVMSRDHQLIIVKNEHFREPSNHVACLVRYSKGLDGEVQMNNGSYDNMGYVDGSGVEVWQKKRQRNTRYNRAIVPNDFPLLEEFSDYFGIEKIVTAQPQLNGFLERTHQLDVGSNGVILVGYNLKANRLTL